MSFRSKMKTNQQAENEDVYDDDFDDLDKHQSPKINKKSNITNGDQKNQFELRKSEINKQN